MFLILNMAEENNMTGNDSCQEWCSYVDFKNTTVPMSQQWEIKQVYEISNYNDQIVISSCEPGREKTKTFERIKGKSLKIR